MARKNEQKDPCFPSKCRSGYSHFGSKLAVPSKAEGCVSHDPEIFFQENAQVHKEFYTNWSFRALLGI